jgi:hypothetical protein
MNVQRVLLAGLLLLPVTSGWAKPTTVVPALPTNAAPTTVQSMIPPDVVEEAGLAKLTATEFAALNRWIEQYATAIFKKALRTGVETNPTLPPVGNSKPVSPVDVIESRIAGDFVGGPSGTKTFRLENGQVWELSSSAPPAVNAHNTVVLIFRQTGTYRMKVEGVPGTFAVRQVR